MTKDEHRDAAGCLLLIGIICTSVSVGYMFEAAAGWATLGLFCVTTALAKGPR